MNIGEKIKELMKERNINTKILSEKIGMTQNGLQKALKKDDIRLSLLADIASALNVEIEYFFSEPKPEQTNTAELTITVKATSNANLSPDQIDLVSLVKAVYPSKTFHVVDTRPILLQVQDVTLKQ